MDYEKKYNEALEKARRLYEGKDKAPEEPILEYLFPELHESEDEKIRQKLIHIVNRYRSVVLNGDDKTYDDCLAYLKVRKEPTYADWSEKDKKMREKLINFLGSPHVPLTYEEFSEYRSWLISLRPQLHWKPSEEQLKALKSCFYESDECCPDEDGLRSLYEDLKKL